jgi:outer membrane protein assembly factor BamE (lipoprotein component of BamABCDE complex)
MSVLIVCAAMLTSCDNPSARGMARFFVRDFGAIPGDDRADDLKEGMNRSQAEATHPFPRD